MFKVSVNFRTLIFIPRTTSLSQLVLLFVTVDKVSGIVSYFSLYQYKHTFAERSIRGTFRSLRFWIGSWTVLPSFITRKIVPFGNSPLLTSLLSFSLMFCLFSCHEAASYPLCFFATLALAFSTNVTWVRLTYLPTLKQIVDAISFSCTYGYMLPLALVSSTGKSFSVWKISSMI